jgi:hypothetical protein
MGSLSKRIVTGNDERGRSRAVVNDSTSKRGLTAEIWRTGAEVASALNDNGPHGSMALMVFTSREGTVKNGKG